MLFVATVPGTGGAPRLLAASAAQTAFLILDASLENGTGRASKALSTALDTASNIDCVAGAITALGPVGLDQVIGGAQLGLRCLGAILKGAGTAVTQTVLGRLFRSSRPPAALWTRSSASSQALAH